MEPPEQPYHTYHNLLQIIADLGANPPDTIQEALKIIGDHFSISTSDIERLSQKDADTIATLIIRSNPSFLIRYRQHRKTKKPLTPSDKKIRSAVSTVAHYLSSLFVQQQSTEIINIQQAEHQRIREIEQREEPHPLEHQETTLPLSFSPLPEDPSIISLEEGVSNHHTPVSEDPFPTEKGGIHLSVAQQKTRGIEELMKNLRKTTTIRQNQIIHHNPFTMDEGRKTTVLANTEEEVHQYLRSIMALLGQHYTYDTEESNEKQFLVFRPSSNEYDWIYIEGKPIIRFFKQMLLQTPQQHQPGPKKIQIKKLPGHKTS